MGPLLPQVAYCTVSLMADRITSRASSGDGGRLSAPALISVCHLVAWALILALKVYLNCTYYRKLQLIGYQRHYVEASWHNQCAHIVLNKATALLLLLWTLFQTLAVNQAQLRGQLPVRLSLEQLLSAETLCFQLAVALFASVAFVFLVRQFLLEMRFRDGRDLPDVFFIETPQLSGEGHLDDVGLQ